MTEQEYLANYDISKFDRPSLAVDIALLSIVKDKPAASIKQNDTNELKVLLIKRASYPFMDKWAMPGGFCNPYENVKDAAVRELHEETCVDNTYMQLVGAYGEKDRDPRGWIISNTYLALVNADDCKPRATSDAWESKWFTVKLESSEISVNTNGTTVTKEIMHNIALIAKDTTGDEIILDSSIIETQCITPNTSTVSFKTVNSDLAFDHGKIITESILRLRDDIKFDKRIVFNMLPATFTMFQLQTALELILDRPLIKTNFTRDMSKFVEPTGETIKEVGFRPAKLYSRKLEL